MADPVPYDPAYSFAGFQAINPARPLPAPQLDNELANISATIGSLIEATKDVRRADGALQNGIVTVESLSSDAIRAFGPNGVLIADAVVAAEAAAEEAVAAEASASSHAAAANAADASASGHADAAAASADQAALYEGVWVDDVAALLADTALTYTSGSPSSVTVGGYVRTRKEGFAYKVAALVATDEHIATAGGVLLYVVASPEVWLDAFGADMTGAAASNDALAKFIAFLRASPTGPTGVNVDAGMKKGRIGKGKVKITSSLVTGSLYGIIIEGSGQFTTSLEYHNDAGAMLDIGSTLYVSLRDMSIVHVPQNADKTTWTNCAISRNGSSGGGRQFSTYNVHVQNFAIFDNIVSTTNDDSSLHVNGYFRDVQTVTKAISSQAVFNHYISCTFWIDIKKIIDIAGYGYTLFESCNILIGGVWVYLRNNAGLWGTISTITFKNCKGEPIGAAEGAVSQIVDFEGNGLNIYADLVFEQCGFSANRAIDPATSQIRVPGNVRLRWDGGNIMPTAKIETVGATAGNGNWTNKPHIRFSNMRAVPGPANVVRTPTGLSGTFQQAITWHECQGVTNQTATTTTASSISDARQTNIVTARAYGALTFGNENIDLPFGSRQRVEEILVFLQRKTGNDLVVTVFSDAARTVLIGTLTLTSADNTGVGVPKIARVTEAVDKIVTAGLYFTITATAQHDGHIAATTVAC